MVFQGWVVCIFLSVLLFFDFSYDFSEGGAFWAFCVLIEIATREGAATEKICRLIVHSLYLANRFGGSGLVFLLFDHVDFPDALDEISNAYLSFVMARPKTFSRESRDKPFKSKFAVILDMHTQEFEAGHIHIHPYSKEDFDLARRFAQDLSVQLKGLLREVVFFGSSARGKATEIYERDIDVLVLLNDGFKSMSNETIAAYRIITEKAASKVSGRLHINTLKVSAFWEYVLNGDPVAVNMIRDGIPLLDAGFIEPFKSLLKRGDIKPSKGNVMVYMIRAPQTLMASKWHVLQAMIDLYWASLDAAHAALIRYGYAPESPKETIQMIDSNFVRKKLIDRSHLATMKELYDISEGIIDRSIKHVEGAKYSSFERRAASFVAEMKKMISESAG